MANPYYDSLTFGGLALISNQKTPYNWAKILPTSRDVDTEWIDLQNVRNQLNLFDDTSQDDYLRLLEATSRFHIEDYLGYSLAANSIWAVYYNTDVTQGPVIRLDVPTRIRKLRHH